MTLLRLDRVEVHVARANASGSDPAPEGLHVWLDLPGGAFEFNHFVVHRGHLEPATTDGAGSGQLDPRWAYWSVWSAGALAVGTTFEPIAGFGYPLPARITGRRLVLPNTRPLAIHAYNLTADATDASGRMAAAHASARDYLVQLHIDATFTLHSLPAGTPLPLFLDHGVGVYNLSEAPPLEPLRPVNPDLGGAGFRPPGSLANTLACYWVEDFQNQGSAGGNSWPLLPLNHATLTLGEVFRGPGCAYFFMRHHRLPNVTMTNPLVHEVVHCLQHDPGLGRRTLEANGMDGPVKSFLGRLLLEGPPPAGAAAAAPGERLYAELFLALHAPPTPDNLMGTSGGVALLPWQVAVIRASPQIGDGP